MVSDPCGLTFAVLTWSTISTIQIKHCVRIILIRNNNIIKIFIIPPEATTHTNSDSENSWPFINSIAAYKSSKTASANSIAILIKDS